VTVTDTAKPFWDDEHDVAEVERSTEHVYRIGYARKGKREYVTVRYWYWQESSRTWQPTRNGMNIPLELAPEVIEALMQAATWGNNHA
jgi:hypothetical protein